MEVATSQATRELVVGEKDEREGGSEGGRNERVCVKDERKKVCIIMYGSNM